MHGLLERIQRQEVDGALNGGLERAGRALVREELGHGLDGQLTEALPLAEEPLLEGGRLDGDPLQQVPLVAFPCLAQRVGRS